MGRESERNTWVHKAKIWVHFVIFGGFTYGLQGSHGFTWVHNVNLAGSDPIRVSEYGGGSEPPGITL